MPALLQLNGLESKRKMEESGAPKDPEAAEAAAEAAAAAAPPQVEEEAAVGGSSLGDQIQELKNASKSMAGSQRSQAFTHISTHVKILIGTSPFVVLDVCWRLKEGAAETAPSPKVRLDGASLLVSVDHLMHLSIGQLMRSLYPAQV